jgi:predicted DCC family thiol-disulfide oxidoreductase YuxK
MATARQVIVGKPQSRDVVLFDGLCRICTNGANQLLRWTKPEQVELVSFRDEGVIDRFPGLTMERCEIAMQLVRNDGYVFEGAEAIVQVLRHRVVGKLAHGYYVPGIRQLADALYRYVARRRFAIAGRTGECKDGTCQLHVP